jgi:hypothetical protein
MHAQLKEPLVSVQVASVSTQLSVAAVHSSMLVQPVPEVVPSPL